MDKTAQEGEGEGKGQKSKKENWVQNNKTSDPHSQRQNYAQLPYELSLIRISYFSLEKTTRYTSTKKKQHLQLPCILTTLITLVPVKGLLKPQMANLTSRLSSESKQDLQVKK